MNTQLNFTGIPHLVTTPTRDTNQQGFEDFHRANPSVYTMIVDIAHSLKKTGFRKCGIALIFERLRWVYAIQTQGDDYRLNNNYRAFYARLVMEKESGLNNFFRVREQRFDYNPAETEVRAW